MISAKVLKDPIIENEKIHKGALVASLPDEIYKEIPKIKKFYYIIERKGWEGINESKIADIKLVEDPSKIKETEKLHPNAIKLNLAGGDFVDTEIFKPLDINKKYDGIQISSWQKFKRHNLFVESASLIPGRKFVKFGHLVYNGRDLEEILLKEKTINDSKTKRANICYPYGDFKENKYLEGKPEKISYWINQAKLGILTTKAEGVNRFKMECLSADLPVLVPEDTSKPVLKHINEKTGRTFRPNPKDLAKTIEDSLKYYSNFSPREYVLRETGKKNSLNQVKSSLKRLCNKDNQIYHFENIEYNGRNQDLVWGEKAITYLKKKT